MRFIENQEPHTCDSIRLGFVCLDPFSRQVQHLCPSHVKTVPYSPRSIDLPSFSHRRGSNIRRSRDLKTSPCLSSCVTSSTYLSPRVSNVRNLPLVPLQSLTSTNITTETIFPLIPLIRVPKFIVIFLSFYLNVFSTL